MPVQPTPKSEEQVQLEKNRSYAGEVQSSHKTIFTLAIPYDLYLEKYRRTSIFFPVPI